VEKKKCSKCNYEWKPRVDDPVECPNCKSRDWDKKKTKTNLEDK